MLLARMPPPPPPPPPPQTHMGPLVSAKQLGILEAQVAQGLAEGAVALAGGKRPAADRCALPGHYFEPTVLGSVASSSSAFQVRGGCPPLARPRSIEAHAAAFGAVPAESLVGAQSSPMTHPYSFLPNQHGRYHNCYCSPPPHPLSFLLFVGPGLSTPFLSLGHPRRPPASAGGTLRPRGVGDALQGRGPRPRPRQRLQVRPRRLRLDQRRQSNASPPSPCLLRAMCQPCASSLPGQSIPGTNCGTPFVRAPFDPLLFSLPLSISLSISLLGPQPHRWPTA